MTKDAGMEGGGGGGGMEGRVGAKKNEKEKRRWVQNERKSLEEQIHNNR